MDRDSVEPPDPDYGDPKELYAFFGLAAYAACNLERSLINWAVVLALNGNATIRTDIDKLYEHFEAQTFGRVLRAVRDKVPVPGDAERLLADALRKRNYLIHDFYADHVEDVVTEAGTRLMIGELRDLYRLFKRADRVATDLYHPLLVAVGVTDELVERTILDFKARIASPSTAT